MASSYNNGDYGFGTTPQYGQEDEKTEEKETKFPKILLMGLRRSGKSSIQKVVFHKMSPNETLFLESTSKIVKEDISNSEYVQFSVWDFPGQIDYFDPSFETEKVFDRCGAIIFIIDAQDDYGEAMNKLRDTVGRAHGVNPDICFEVFIHKVDGLSDETRLETQRDISQRWSDDCLDLGLENKVKMSFHLTSIYDHSIFESFSKVVQKLIPQLPTLEALLNIFTTNSLIDKAFLFDVVSKIYIATDSNPVDIQSYELCCDMIDVVLDVSCIYGIHGETESTAFDHKSSSIIKLNNSTVLYMREVSDVLALVCILRQENFRKEGFLDYNFSVLRDAMKKIFKVREEIASAKLAKDQEEEEGETGDQAELSQEVQKLSVA